MNYLGSIRISLPLKICKEKIIQLFNQRAGFHISEENNFQFKILIKDFIKNVERAYGLIPVKRTGTISFEGDGETQIKIKIKSTMYNILRLVIPINFLIMSGFGIFLYIFTLVKYKMHALHNLIPGLIFILTAIGFYYFFSWGIRREEKLIEDIIFDFLTAEH